MKSNKKTSAELRQGSRVIAEVRDPVGNDGALRESEARLLELVELSSDWYWEQDAELRFVATGGTSEARGGITPDAHIGKRRWELPGTDIVNQTWDEHKEVLAARKAFRDLVLRRTDERGEFHYVSVSGRPITDSSGSFRGYRGIATDITEPYRAGQLREAEHAVNRGLANANTASSGLRAAIQTVCALTGWECGRYFRLDEDAGVLRFSDAWGVADPAIEQFIQASRGLVYRRGSGLSGRVWETGAPLWSSDVTKDGRASGSTQVGALRAPGVHGTFVFPVKADGKMVGVLSFACRTPRPPDQHLMDAIVAIGGQVGQFLHRKYAEEQLRASEARFRALTELSSDWYWEQDEQFRFRRLAGQGANANARDGDPSAYIGLARWEVADLTPISFTWDEHRAQLERHEAFRDLVLKRHMADGGFRYLAVSGRPMFDTAGAFIGYGGIGRDVTERRLDEERIRYLANHDALTGLPNRTSFGDLLSLAMGNARRRSGALAVMFVDLDRFKIINDTLGHDAGDQLLCEMGTRLRDTLRETDVVARLGGDEFVVLVQEVKQIGQLDAVAGKILAAVAKPMLIQGRECSLTASIGICLYPQDAADEQSLMKNADTAMYRAKDAGKNCYKFYSDSSNTNSVARLELETGLRRGIEANAFFLHYQPRVDLKSGEIVGVEALVRWNHPKLGVVPPAEFIPLAEETGTVVELGAWVLRTACAQAVAWQKEGLPKLRMAVNVSARQLASEDLVNQIRSALKTSGLAPDFLELELTESAVAQNIKRATMALAEIRDLGVHLALDDFGTGYSSLAQLKQFPLDALKVDRSFIADLPHDEEDAAITRAIIAMGASLGLKVVAEGVETPAQRTFLEAQGCDEMQGFLFSRPLAADDFAAMWNGTWAPDRR